MKDFLQQLKKNLNWKMSKVRDSINFFIDRCSYTIHKKHSLILDSSDEGGGRYYDYQDNVERIEEELCRLFPHIQSEISRCEYLGSGWYGKVYLTNDNKTYKITSDINEIEMALHLLNNDYKYFIKVYKVTRIYCDKTLVGGIILKEYVEVVNTSLNYSFWSNMSEYVKSRHNVNVYNVPRTWFVDTDYDKGKVLVYLMNKGENLRPYHTIIYNKESIKKEFDKFRKYFKLETLDVHSENFGFNNGEFKLFDVSGFKARRYS